MDDTTKKAPGPWTLAVSKALSEGTQRVNVRSRVHMADLPNRHERRARAAQMRRAKWSRRPTL